MDKNIQAAHVGVNSLAKMSCWLYGGATHVCLLQAIQGSRYHGIQMTCPAGNSDAGMSGMIKMCCFK